MRLKLRAVPTLLRFVATFLRFAVTKGCLGKMKQPLVRTKQRFGKMKQPFIFGKGRYWLARLKETHPKP
jgi:hypothetical protein